MFYVIPTGKTVKGVFGNHTVSEHPYTGAEMKVKRGQGPLAGMLHLAYT